MTKKAQAVHRATPSYPDETIPARWTYDKLVAQAYRDVNEDWLWVGREAYRATLQQHLAWHVRGSLNQGGLKGMWHIIEVNNDLREKKATREKAAAAAAPSPEPAPAPSPEAPPTSAPVEDRVASILVQQATEIAALRAENTRLREQSAAR